MSAELNQGRRDAVAIGTLILECNAEARDVMHSLTVDLVAEGPDRVHNALVALGDLWLDTVRAYFVRCPCGASEEEHARRVLKRLGACLAV